MQLTRRDETRSKLHIILFFYKNITFYITSPIRLVSRIFIYIRMQLTRRDE